MSLLLIYIFLLLILKIDKIKTFSCVPKIILSPWHSIYWWINRPRGHVWGLANPGGCGFNFRAWELTLRESVIGQSDSGSINHLKATNASPSAAGTRPASPRMGLWWCGKVLECLKVSDHNQQEREKAHMLGYERLFGATPSGAERERLHN